MQCGLTEKSWMPSSKPENKSLSAIMIMRKTSMNIASASDNNGKILMSLAIACFLGCTCS